MMVSFFLNGPYTASFSLFSSFQWWFIIQGRGFTAASPISKGEFVVEYSGDLIDVKAAKERETKYAMDLSMGCYMYYFRANNRQYW